METGEMYLELAKKTLESDFGIVFFFESIFFVSFLAITH